jgi:beta-galactosidase beta subunit
MIVGSLSETNILQNRFTHRAAFEICFNWLKQIPSDTSVGKYRIDHGLINAEIIDSRILGENLESETWMSPFPYVIIHVVLLGIENVQVKIESDSENKLLINLITIGAGQFCLLFPNEKYKIDNNGQKSTTKRKVVFSIPVQRVE